MRPKDLHQPTSAAVMEPHPAGGGGRNNPLTMLDNGTPAAINLSDVRRSAKERYPPPTTRFPPPVARFPAARLPPTACRPPPAARLPPAACAFHWPILSPFLCLCRTRRACPSESGSRRRWLLWCWPPPRPPPGGEGPAVESADRGERRQYHGTDTHHWHRQQTEGGSAVSTMAQTHITGTY